jgi:nucleotide-binding universal stress UspA family protein
MVPTQKFSKILVAIDGSENSLTASDVAIEMAKRNNGELVVLHVSHVSNTELYLTPAKQYKEFIKKYNQDLEGWISKIRKNAKTSKVEMKADVINAAPNVVAAIVDYADKKNIDLIIIGTRGNSGFKKLLLGSVAVGVVMYASCPVMVIK